MQLKNPDDFVICTEEVHSVKEWLDESFKYAGLNSNDYVKIDSKLIRPSKTDVLTGDTVKARKAFGFKAKTRFKDLIKIMMEHELKEAEKEPSAKH